MHEGLGSVSTGRLPFCSPIIPSAWGMITGGPEAVASSVVSLRLAWDLESLSRRVVSRGGTCICILCFSFLFELAVAFMFGVGDDSTLTNLSVEDCPPACLQER